MKSEKAQNIKVGIFVIGLSVVVLFTVFLLGGSADILEHKYTLNGKWEDVAGLKEGAVVRLAGWDVGEVSAIKFGNALDQRELTVTMRILDRYADRIRADSEARIDTVGVLGDKYVSISMGTPTSDGLSDGGVIQTQPALDFLGYTNKFEDILLNTEAITKKFNLMLGTNDEAASAKLGKSMAHVETLLAHIQEGRGLFSAVVHDEEIASNFKSIVRNLNKSSASIAGVMNQIQSGEGIANALIYGEGGARLTSEMATLTARLGKLTQDIQDNDSMLHSLIYDGEKVKILDDLGETIASLKRTTAAVETGKGTLGLLAQDPALYEDLRALVGGAQRNKLLRAYIRTTIEKGEEVNASGWTPEIE